MQSDLRYEVQSMTLVVATLAAAVGGVREVKKALGPGSWTPAWEVPSNSASVPSGK